MYTVRKGYVFIGKNTRRYEAGSTVNSKLEAIAGQEWKLEKQKKDVLPGQTAQAKGPAASNAAAPAGSIWNKGGNVEQNSTGTKSDDAGKSA